MKKSEVKVYRERTLTFYCDVRKIAAGLNMDEQTFSGMLSRSMVVSADNAHALHPGYTGKSDTNNRPVLMRELL